jgi:hypothetical protein
VQSQRSDGALHSNSGMRGSIDPSPHWLMPACARRMKSTGISEQTHGRKKGVRPIGLMWRIIPAAEISTTERNSPTAHTERRQRDFDERKISNLRYHRQRNKVLMVNRTAEDCRSIVRTGQHQPYYGALANIARDGGSLLRKRGGYRRGQLRAHVQLLLQCNTHLKCNS